MDETQFAQALLEMKFDILVGADNMAAFSQFIIERATSAGGFTLTFLVKEDKRGMSCYLVFKHHIDGNEVEWRIVHHAVLLPDYIDEYLSVESNPIWCHMPEWNLDTCCQVDTRENCDEHTKMVI